MFSILDNALAQKTSRLELNSALMESTFRIDGPGSWGTAFVLGRPYDSDPKKARYVLVTAAHVLEQMGGETATLRMRRKKEGNKWDLEPVTLRIREGNRVLWTKHPEVDVAVMYLRIPTGLIQGLIATSLLADDKMLADFEIHPGDELNCLGYPLGAESEPFGFPILRSGKIASYPLLPTAERKTFLFDFHIFPGNSGGPVYFVQSNRSYGNSVQLGTEIHMIVGLVSKEKRVTQEIVELYGRREQSYPLGLAEIVHASLIKEAVNMLPSPDSLKE